VSGKREQLLGVPIARPSIEERDQSRLCASPFAIIKLLDGSGVAGSKVRLKQFSACLGC